jgi:hypothetical protein
MHQIRNRIQTKHNESGLVSIITVSIVVIILALMTTGFAKVMDRELRQSLDRELAVQANYAAESGMNDARNYISKEASTDTAGDCLKTNALNGTQTPYFVDNGNVSTDAGSLVKYTCVNIDTNPKELVYDIDAGKSKIIRVAASDTLDKLYFSWNNKQASATSNSTALPATGSYPAESYWSTAGNEEATGVLRTTIYPVFGTAALPVDGDQNTTLESLARNYFMYPSSGPAGTFGSVAMDSSNGISVSGKCHQNNFTTPPALPLKTKYFCNTEVYNLTASAPSSPTVSVIASSHDITAGGNVNISWNVTNATSCTPTTQPAGASANWTTASFALTAGSGNGTVAVNNLTTSAHFVLTCIGTGGGANGHDSVTVHQAPFTITRNGIDYGAFNCIKIGPPDGDNTGIDCTNNGNSVFNYQDYRVTYSVRDAANQRPPGGQYQLTLHYNNFVNGAFPTPPCGSYNFAIKVVNSNSGVRNESDLQLSTCSTTSISTINVANSVSGMYFEWDNDQWVAAPGCPAPGCDPNFQIDSFTITELNPAVTSLLPSYTPPALPPAPGNAFYYVKLTALYKDLTVSVQGANAVGNSVNFKKAQAVVDVTAKGNDVLKRLQSRVSQDPDFSYPQFALDSMDTLCKKLRLPVGPGGPTDYQPAVIDDANADGACKP